MALDACEAVLDAGDVFSLITSNKFEFETEASWGFGLQLVELFVGGSGHPV